MSSQQKEAAEAEGEEAPFEICKEKLYAVSAPITALSSTSILSLGQDWPYAALY